MPSLRRTVSTPLVRSSPYPSSLSASASLANVINNGGAIATATRTRRSASGSDTSRRRVLADITWWRVLDGQQPEEPELDEDQDAADAAAVAASPVVETAPASDILLQNAISAAEALVAEQLLNATAPARTDGEFETSSLATPFSALTISAASTPPLTPARRRREASDASDISDISFESIDSFDSFEPTPISSPVDVFMDSCGPFAISDGIASMSIQNEKLGYGPRRPSVHGSCSQMGRSVSFGGFPSASLFEDEDRFDDVVFL